MRPWMIRALIAIAGFGGGFAAGFWTHKRMNDIKFEEITEEEMAALEKDTAKPAPAEEPKQEKREETPSEDAELPEDPAELKKAFQGKTTYIQADAKQKKAYEKMWQATSEYSNEENANQLPVEAVEEEGEDGPGEYGEETFDEDFLEQIEQEAEAAGNNFTDPPHEIDLSAFYNEHPDYDKITIHFYEPDNVWFDESDELIEDITSYIGMEVKDPFLTNKYNNDPDVRFWTNDRYGSDYELIRHHRSYLDTVGER